MGPHRRTEHLDAYDTLEELEMDLAPDTAATEQEDRDDANDQADR